MASQLKQEPPTKENLSMQWLGLQQLMTTIDTHDKGKTDNNDDRYNDDMKKATAMMMLIRVIVITAM